MPPPRRPDPQASSGSSPSGTAAGVALKEENIYIPSFISKRPFYAGDEDAAQTDYLQHQRLQKQEKDSKWYDRGRKAGPAATKFRKGACENCGAMTHSVKNCLERPRALGAKWSGADIKADEVIQDMRLGWDAKRDRWNGYDASEYNAVIDTFGKMEELRREAQRSARRKSGPDGHGDDVNDDGVDGGGDSDSESDLEKKREREGDRYAEESDMSRHQSTATRQLRMREDTAKYLLNLDLDSARYDPKTRTLVDPGATADRAADLFAEEGFLRGAGDAEAMMRAQRYAWEAQEKTGDTGQHLQANPTAGEVLRKKEREAAEQKRAERERLLLEQYGDANNNNNNNNKDPSQKSLPAAARPMAVTESERFVEYDEHGLIKGAPRTILRSKYPENVLVNNHTTVWGSWWHDFAWGYACCHSQTKGSYCMGDAGREAWEAAERRRMGLEGGEGGLETAGSDNGDTEARTATAASSGRNGGDGKGESKKRTREEMIGGGGGGGVTEVDLDEYRRKRTVADDPMAKMLGRDELVS